MSTALLTLTPAQSRCLLAMEGMDGLEACRADLLLIAQDASPDDLRHLYANKLIKVRLGRNGPLFDHDVPFVFGPAGLYVELTRAGLRQCRTPERTFLVALGANPARSLTLYRVKAEQPMLSNLCGNGLIEFHLVRTGVQLGYDEQPEYPSKLVSVSLTRKGHLYLPRG